MQQWRREDMEVQVHRLTEQLDSRKAADLILSTSDGTYLRRFLPNERVIIFGGGNVGREVCRYASTLGFEVTIVDDRPDYANSQRHPEATHILCEDMCTAIENLAIGEQDYVIVVTRGHQYDLQCLRAILTKPMPTYLGMMGSKRRVRGIYQMLAEEGISKERLDLIRMPIGIKIGSRTPAEIAISIVAELIQVRRNAIEQEESPGLLSLRNSDESLIQLLKDDTEPKALLIVIDTKGSTPVKSGAAMALTKRYVTAGTIGGGCTEGEALREAACLIGTGESTVISLTMTEEAAEEEGMACGGRMSVWIGDLTCR